MPSKTKKALKKAISRPQPPSVLKPTHSNPSSSSSSSVVMLEPTPEMLAKLVQDNDDEAVLGETSTFMEALDNDDQQITMNPEFSFEFGGGGILENAAVSSSSWNFTEAKAAFGGSRQRGNGATSIDDKIKKVASNHQAAAEEDSEEEEEEVEVPQEDSESEIELGNQVGEEDDDSEDGDSSNEEDNNVQLEEEEEEDTVRDKKIADYFEEAPVADPEDQFETFTDMRLSRPILKGVASLGFVKPTLIQSSTVPLALKGKDICGAAVTGSGKTAAFIIPILERLLFRPKNVPTTRVLILVPTRELGAQCHSVAKNLAKFTDIQFCLCVGGLSTKVQEQELKLRPDVVIATPGRLIDHIHNSQSFNLDSVEILVMDEADRMLDDGFAAELNEIIRNCPKGRQTMLFSATMTDNVDDLIKLSLNRPVRLFVNAATTLTSRLTQEFIRIRSAKEKHKAAILAALCCRTYKTECIVFFKSKVDAHAMKITFGLLGLKAAELHGALNQLQRLEALELFRDKKVDFLLATDLASRGLDIAGIKTVINYDMPTQYPLYVHRVGRTARAGMAGRAVSLVQESDRKILKLAVKNAGAQSHIKNRIIPATIISRYVDKITAFDGQVDEIRMEEKEEKAMQRAEMEVNRASNLITHQDEIMSRPRKEWFQSQADTQAQKQLGVRNHEGGGSGADGGNKKRKASGDKDEDIVKPKKRSPLDGLSRKKKRAKQLLMEDEKSQIRAQSIAARSAKTASKPQRVKQIAERSSNGGGRGSGKSNGMKKGNFSSEVRKASAGKRKHKGGRK